MNNVFINTKKGILILALLATVSGFANDGNMLSKRDSKKVALVLEHVKEGNLLYIKDSYDLVLYKETIEDNGLYKKGFNLTELPDGHYFFELEKYLEVNKIPFSVESNNVIFKKEDEATYFKPYIKQKGNLVLVTKLAPMLDKTLIEIFAIYDNEVKLRYSEKIENEKVIEKAFKLEKGNYKIVINSNNKEYTTFINN
ncbi:MAG: hypothetical protein P8K68_00020 [Algibacter sp.]|uniref:hypothetical protein n=1 Tax=Algibacter sp. TaxID=1872428 RepID=UPI002607983D|nr:hypothetical protein [Algibacter sp.]MDG1730100.1 hypothetical protein [Algibacter sp.]MDG2177161.1 hypothetical protein [Algibacter sp.]